MHKVVGNLLFTILFVLSVLVTQGLAEEKPEVFVQMGHARYVLSISVSPDGKYMLSHSYNTIMLWDIKTRRLIKIFERSPGQREKVTTILPDGRHALSQSADPFILKLWEIETGKEIRRFKVKSPFNHITLSLNGKYVLLESIAYGTTILNVETGEEIWRIGPFLMSSISRDLRYAQIGGIGALELIETMTGKKIWIFKTETMQRTGYDIMFRSTAISLPLKFALAIDGNDELYVLDLISGKVIRKYKVPPYSKFLYISSDGGYALIRTKDTLERWDVVVGRQIRSIKFKFNDFDFEEKVKFSSDGRYFITYKEPGIGSDILENINIYSSNNLEKILQLRGHEFTTVTFHGDEVIAGDNKGNIFFWDILSNKEVNSFASRQNRQTYVVEKFDKYLVTVSNRKLIVWGIDNASFVTETENIDSIRKYVPKEAYKGNNILVTGEAKSLDSRYRASVDSAGLGTLKLFDAKGNKELAQFISFEDGEWIVITPEGYYNASPNGDKYLNVRVGNEVYGIENYREAFFRPDLVKLALSGKSLKDYKTLADVKQPPLVEIVDTPQEVQADEVKVTVRLTDIGGGIGDVRLYLNDTSISLDSARGLRIVPKTGEKTIYKTYTVKLLSGENIIKAVAFNEEGSMASNPALKKIVSLAKAFKKPSMYVVAIGINEYKNPKLELKYAAADAKLFADTIRQVATPLFEKVNITLLTTKEETTKENIKKTLEGLKSLNPDDVFVFYVASHGTVDEGEYFLITSNVGSLSTFRLKEDALTQTELKELIANVPSTKKMVVIDTCNAGKLGEALQVAMLTRGMSEETAMKILSRAVGSTILSASTSLQEALEGYQGHGLFTYVLSEGLKGKADMDRDGFIKTLEIASYVDSEVPALAEKVFKRAQYPTAAPTGQSFPVGKVR